MNENLTKPIPLTPKDLDAEQAEQADTPMSVGDLITLAVALIKNHPEILSKDYELREKE